MFAKNSVRMVFLAFNFVVLSTVVVLNEDILSLFQSDQLGKSLDRFSTPINVGVGSTCLSCNVIVLGY